MCNVLSGCLLCVTLVSGSAWAADDFVLGPDSQKQEGVPAGKLLNGKYAATAQHSPGTERDDWIDIPAQSGAAKTAALKISKYDDRFGYGDGGHNGQHDGAILPDSLRWLWRE